MRFGTSFNVNLPLLKENFLKLKELAPKCETIFMVKADAYGHGLIEITRYAFEECGIKRFGVATLKEAIFLRKNLPFLEFELWVFSDLNLELEEVKELYLDFNIVPVLSSLRQLELVVEDKEFDSMPLVLKFDTGMNRLGIQESEVDDCIQLLKSKQKKSLKHVLTHFSSSYLPINKNQKTKDQLELFSNIKLKLNEADIIFEESSCANSGAIEQGIGLEETHIRPGLMLYGPQSTFSKSVIWKGNTISSLKIEVLKTRAVKKGECIGYGDVPVKEDGHLLYLAIGYGDGLSTNFEKVAVEINGEKGHFHGRVNMDMAVLFFKNLPKIKDNKVELWSKDASVVIGYAKQTGSIPYEIFTSLTARVPRSYIQ